MGLFDFFKKKSVQPISQSHNATPMASFSANQDLDDKPYQTCHTAPYRTIELMFSGIQREGVRLSVEIEKWPSLERSSLCWYEWNQTGGSVDRVDLPTNYISEHTVDEFIDEYIMKDNEAIKHIHYSQSEEFLNKIRITLTESGIFKQ